MRKHLYYENPTVGNHLFKNSERKVAPKKSEMPADVLKMIGTPISCTDHILEESVSSPQGMIVVLQCQ